MFDLAATRMVTAREPGCDGRAGRGTADGGLGTTDPVPWLDGARCVCTRRAGRRTTSRGLPAGRERCARAPDFPGVPRLAPAEVVDLLHAGQQGLDEALGALPAHVVEGLTPMPFGVVPTVIAMQITVYEYAFHLDDARTALGQATALPADVAAALVAFFPRLGGMLARRAAPGEMTHAYRFVAPSGTVTVAPAGDITLPICTITGSDDAIALFCMGRVGIDDTRLAVDEAERRVAGAFKRWFPGP